MSAPKTTLRMERFLRGATLTRDRLSIGLVNNSRINPLKSESLTPVKQASNVTVQALHSRCVINRSGVSACHAGWAGVARGKGQAYETGVNNYSYP
jgi:hypothetical protein